MRVGPLGLTVHSLRPPPMCSERLWGSLSPLTNGAVSLICIRQADLKSMFYSSVAYKSIIDTANISGSDPREYFEIRGVHCIVLCYLPGCNNFIYCFVLVSIIQYFIHLQLPERAPTTHI
jgi:hypothetical protein